MDNALSICSGVRARAQTITARRNIAIERVDNDNKACRSNLNGEYHHYFISLFKDIYVTCSSEYPLGGSEVPTDANSRYKSFELDYQRKRTDIFCTVISFLLVATLFTWALFSFNRGKRDLIQSISTKPISPPILRATFAGWISQTTDSFTSLILMIL